MNIYERAKEAFFFPAVVEWGASCTNIGNQVTLPRRKEGRKEGAGKGNREREATDVSQLGSPWRSAGRNPAPQTLPCRKLEPGEVFSVHLASAAGESKSTLTDF